MHAEGKTLALFYLHQQPKVRGSLACSGRVQQQYPSSVHQTCSEFSQCKKPRVGLAHTLCQSRITKTETESRRPSLSMSRMRFRKGYLPGWTDKLFQVARVFRDNPPYYKIKDLGGEWLEGTFYEEELQKTYKKDDVF